MKCIVGRNSHSGTKFRWNHHRTQQVKHTAGRNSHSGTEVVEFHQRQEHPVSGHQVTSASASLQGAGVLRNLLIAAPAAINGKHVSTLINKSAAVLAINSKYVLTLINNSPAVLAINSKYVLTLINKSAAVLAINSKYVLTLINKSAAVPKAAKHLNCPN